MIRFVNLEISEIANSSGVFSGNNVQMYWTYTDKTNEGFSMSGEGNKTSGSAFVIHDNDHVDTVYK